MDYVKMRFDKGETGWAEDLGDNRYRVSNVPLSDGLHFGDIVEFEEGVDLYSGNFRIVEKGLDQKLVFSYSTKRSMDTLSERCNLDEFKPDVCLEGWTHEREGPEGGSGMAALCYKSTVDIEKLFKGLDDDITFEVEEN